jgi:hypothetical protein
MAGRVDDHGESDITWEESEQKRREFQGLLRKYDNDWQKATDAQLRGEKPDPEDEAGSPNPM